MRFKHWHIIILALLLEVTAPHAQAQFSDLKWEHLDSKDGFPSFDDGLEMVQDNLGRIWMSYDNGLHCYDGSELVKYTRDAADSTSLAQDITRAVFIDSQGKIWVSTIDMGVAIYDPVTDRFKSILPIEEGGSLPIGRIWSIFEDASGIMWLAGKPGLLRYDRREGIFEHFLFTASGYSEIELEYFNIQRDVVGDPDNPNRLFIGTRSGLLSFDKLSSTFTHHQAPFDTPVDLDPDIRDYMIMDLLFVNDSMLWMSTWAGGILEYNTKSETWHQHRDPNVDDLLDIGRRLRFRDNQSLWIASYVGFGIFNTVNHTYVYSDYMPADANGLRYAVDFCFTPDSTILVQTNRGLFIGENYSGYNASRETYEPILTQIKVNGQKYLSDTSSTHLQNLDLEDDENNLTFKVSWPVYSDRDNVEYQFKLVGFTDEWVNNGRSRTIQYTNLKGGNYVLHYRAGRGDGHWIAGKTSLALSIFIPIWRRPAFIIGIAIALMCLLYFAYRYQINQMKIRERLEIEFNKRLANQEMATLRAQMNPHFLFNSLNSVKTYILKEKTEEASMYLTKFSQLMRAVLRNSKSQLVTLSEEIHTLTLYIELEVLRFQNKFEFTIQVDPDISSEQLFIPPLLIQPYVENAIRHGLLAKKEGAKLLHISVTGKGAEQILIIVADNGVGRKKAQQKKRIDEENRKSYGMQITKDRISLIQKTLGITAKVVIHDLHDDNGQPSGTSVEITIPRIINK